MTTNVKERIEELEAKLDKYDAMEDRRTIRFLMKMAEIAKKYENGEISEDLAISKVKHRSKCFVERINGIEEMYKETANEIIKLEA